MTQAMSDITLTVYAKCCQVAAHCNKSCDTADLLQQTCLSSKLSPSVQNL